MVQESMFQDSLIVMTRIRDGMLEDLREALADIGKDPAGNEWMPFGQCGTVHYARWAVLEKVRDFPAQLVFATDFDLPLESHLDELISAGRRGLDRVYACCEGYPGSSASAADVAAYLGANRVTPEARYQGAHVRTRAQIETEGRWREEVQQLVDDELNNGGRALGAPALASSVMESVRGQESLRGLLTPPPSPGWGWWLRDRAAAAWGAVKALPRLAAVGTFSPWLLVDEKRRAASWTATFPAQTDVQAKIHLQSEDEQLQNQMTFVTEIRPSWLWRWTLEVVLAWIEFRCRVWDVKGGLGRTFRGGESSGVQTIHFCQWLIIDRGQRLLFLTNYDGAFERYLDDFLDFNSIGVNGIWGPSRDYPPTRFLFWLRRATHREIKAFFRTHQVKTDVWYSAYPRLALTNINESSSWRERVAGNGGDVAALLGGL